MTRMNWSRVHYETKIKKNGLETHEDYLPKRPEPGTDPPARPEEIIRKRKKVLSSGVTKTSKAQEPPKAKKAQRRTGSALALEAKERVKEDSFRKALSDPQSAINRAAEKTRRRWEKKRVTTPKGSSAR